MPYFSSSFGSSTLATLTLTCDTTVLIYLLPAYLLLVIVGSVVLLLFLLYMMISM